MENAYICTMLKNVFNIFILLLASTAVLSCSDVDSDIFERPDEELVISISGTASDLSTGEPIEEIKITVHAAEYGDKDNVNLVSKTTYTDNTGRFSISAEGFSYSTTCLVTAEDPNGIYADASQEIKISWSATSMQGNTFYVNECDFYLEKNQE